MLRQRGLRRSGRPRERPACGRSGSAIQRSTARAARGGSDRCGRRDVRRRYRRRRVPRSAGGRARAVERQPRRQRRVDARPEGRLPPGPTAEPLPPEPNTARSVCAFDPRTPAEWDAGACRLPTRVSLSRSRRAPLCSSIDRRQARRAHGTRRPEPARREPRPSRRPVPVGRRRTDTPRSPRSRSHGLLRRLAPRLPPDVTQPSQTLPRRVTAFT